MIPVALYYEVDIGTGREALPSEHRHIPKNSTEQIEFAKRESVAYKIKKFMHRRGGSADISFVANNVRIIEEIRLLLYLSVSRGIPDQSDYPRPQMILGHSNVHIRSAHCEGL